MRSKRLWRAFIFGVSGLFVGCDSDQRYVDRVESYDGPYHQRMQWESSFLDLQILPQRYLKVKGNPNLEYPVNFKMVVGIAGDLEAGLKHYLSYRLEHDIYLLAATDTLRPAYYLMENLHGLSQGNTILFGFDTLSRMAQETILAIHAKPLASNPVYFALPDLKAIYE